jgi:hypothetical protein
MYGFVGTVDPFNPNFVTPANNWVCLVITITGTATATNVQVQGTITGALKSLSGFSGSSTIAPNASAIYTSTPYFSVDTFVLRRLDVSIQVTMGTPPAQDLTWQGTVQNPFSKSSCTLA